MREAAPGRLRSRGGDRGGGVGDLRLGGGDRRARVGV